MSNRRIRQLVILGVFSIAGTLFFQAYWVIHTWRLNAEAFDRQVTYALRRVAQNLADLNGSQLPATDLVRRKSSHYYVVNTRDVIEPAVLEFFLRREMDSVALRLDYEYAIFDCESDQMAYGKYVAYDAPEAYPAEPSFPKEMGLNYYFGVQFPTMGSHLLARMGFSLGLAMVSFISLLFSSFSLYVLLKQKRLSELQKDFINNITHEFKTPISTIHLAAGVLTQAQEVRSSQRLSKYAQIIAEQNQRLNNQVGKVLQLAKLDQRTLLLEKERVNLGELIEKVLKNSELMAGSLQGKIHWERPPYPVWVEADPFHTTHVIYNLLDNALKYAQPQPEVEIVLFQEGHKIRLILKDNGPGIDPGYQKRITEKFFRVPTGNIHNVKGFGLGLYYVKKICEEHRWSFRIHCPDAGGTQVEIEVNATKANRYGKS
jgi:two-component system phosphate regulon sensor histidine kinase PhoR